MASRSSWPGFPPSTLSAVSRDRGHRQMTNSMRQNRAFVRPPPQRIIMRARQTRGVYPEEPT
jgi:RNase P protein component